ncbi:MAG: nucleoside triphosphate pyrophosphohydrolase [Bacillota bacterium]|nr:nucleoside triphosphate pyrophosphohydrolase [Bacillota bacterium]MDW7676921.1 nucleoside triphosphate pyrophosphohydrolase [Bacillota bacterium]
MKTIPYHKLIRDRIPEIIEATGKTAVTEVLSAQEYLDKLHDKLGEELQEYHETHSIDELVDLVEVIYAILDYRCVSRREFEEIRELKSERRGSFQKRLFLKAVIDPDPISSEEDVP